MKKIERITQLNDCQYVYVRYKVDFNDDKDYPVCLRNENNSLIHSLDVDFKITRNRSLELFMAEPSENPEQLNLPIVGKQYSFGNVEDPYVAMFMGFSDENNTIWGQIRPLPQPSQEELKFLELAEKFRYKYEIKQK